MEKPPIEDRLKDILSPERRVQLCRTLDIPEDASAEEIILAYIEDNKQLTNENADMDIQGAINMIRDEWGSDTN